jgi:predicted metal-dependent HD superfamily phosphohydrolase
MNDLQYLTNSWNSVLIKREALLKELLSVYSKPGRYYHNLSHIAYMLKLLDKMFEKTPNTSLIKLAIWFHDFVQHPGRSDNEEESAKEARGRLYFTPEPSLALIVDMVLDTKHEETPRTPEGQILCDLDLAILGSDPKSFALYEDQVRLEYPKVSDERYNSKRKEVMGRLCSRPYGIYYTREFKRLGLEEQARINLNKYL